MGIYLLKQRTSLSVVARILSPRSLRCWLVLRKLSGVVRFVRRARISSGRIPSQVPTETDSPATPDTTEPGGYHQEREQRHPYLGLARACHRGSGLPDRSL